MKKINKIQIPLRVDPISDEYTLSIPESFINHFDWYEDMLVNISIDGDGLYIENAE